MNKKLQIHNSTAEFFIFQIENKEEFIKEKIEKTAISLQEKVDIDEPEDGKKTKKTKKKNKEEVYPRLNFAISTYYKGTGLEEVLKKLENYLDNADINESDINNI